MSSLSRISASLLFVMVILGFSIAEIPKQMTYQGLLNESGTPVSANTNLTFRIYDVENDGNHLWEEVHIGVPVLESLFQVELGRFTPIDLPFDSEYWLAIQVESDPELSPRLKMNSSGYAYASLSADSSRTVADSAVTTEKIADGAVTQAKLAADISLNASGPAGGDLGGNYPGPTVTAIQNQAISTNSPSRGQVLEWNGVEWAPSTDDVGPGISAGTTNRLTKYISATDIGDSDIYETDTGRIGIGTTFPAAKLMVEELGTDDPFRVRVSGTTRMIVRNDGNVGIGTVNPSTKLDVVGNIEFNGNVDIIPNNITRALDVVGSTFLSGQFVNFETTGSIIGGQDILQVKGGVASAGAFQLIEAETLNDIQFSVDSNGDVRADGVFTGGGADFAEMIEISSGPGSAEPGDVMVIDPKNTRAIIKSTSAHSSLIAGIYSTQPGFLGSERDWDVKSGDESRSYTMKEMADNFNEIPMAVVGIVPCKVSAENGSIEPGSLLVSSTIPGHAMREDNPRIGTVLGKALEPLNSGTGTIKVLLTLQ